MKMASRPFKTTDMVVANDKNGSLTTNAYDIYKNTFKDMVSFFRQYPDYYLDYIRSENALFELSAFQRLWLRALFRFKKVGIVASRGTSKSYINILSKVLKCIFYPNTSEIISAPTKQQTTKIVQDKLMEYFRDYPMLKSELVFKGDVPKGSDFTKIGSDFATLVFRNGSKINTIVMGESSRGLRANGISIEEITDDRVDPKIVNEVLLPIANLPRRAGKWGIDYEHEYSPTQAWVTTASHKQSYAYDKFATMFQEMVDGKPTIVLGCDFRMGVEFGTLSRSEVFDKYYDKSYSPLSFDREYNSIFTGSSEQSLVTVDAINNCRTLSKPEWKATRADKDNPRVMYVLSYDVARSGGVNNAQSILAVIKCILRDDGTYRKQLVNIFNVDSIVHFKAQAQFLKQKVNEYGARILIIDHNGVGKGLTDELVQEIDENPPYAVVNDDRLNYTKKPNSLPILFLFNSTRKEMRSSDVISHFITVINKGDMQLLKSEIDALANNSLRKLDEQTRTERILPFVQTDILVDEVMNLEYVLSGSNVSTKPISPKIQKDRYSALSYGLWWIYLEEQKNIKRKNKRTFSMGNSFKGVANVKKPKYKFF